MLKFLTGSIGDYRYRATWGRGARNVVIWEGSVFRDGRLVGGPSGQLSGVDDDAKAEMEVRSALEAAVLSSRHHWK